MARAIDEIGQYLTLEGERSPCRLVLKRILNSTPTYNECRLG